MQMKKRFAQTAAVLFMGVLLYAFGVWESGRQNLFTGEKEKRFYPTRTEAQERAKEEPVLCVPAGEAYLSGEETGIAEGLLAELQEYVSRGEQSEAMEAYRDETLIVDVEDLLNLCPEYESLIEEMAKNNPFSLEELDLLQDVAGIYRIPLEREENDILLVQYAGHFRGGILFKKTEAGYLAGHVRIGTDETDAYRAGRARFSQFLEPYEIDREEDREEFLQFAGIEDDGLASLYGWAYHFTSPDGAEYFLADWDCGGTLGVCTLQLFDVEEEGHQYAELVDYYRGDYSGIVLFEGQVYCIITDYDFGTKKLCGVHILPLNDRGEWEHYYLSLTPDVENYQPLCLYGGQEAALSDYVESVYGEALSASVEREIFTGIGENAVITAELRRSIKNKDIYVFWNTVPYKVINADNDGE